MTTVGVTLYENEITRPECNKRQQEYAVTEAGISIVIVTTTYARTNV
jgi:hypothetical protein